MICNCLGSLERFPHIEVMLLVGCSGYIDCGYLRMFEQNVKMKQSELVKSMVCVFKHIRF